MSAANRKQTGYWKGAFIGTFLSIGVTFAQAATPAPDAHLPAIFTSASQTGQNRICGELLIGLAISGMRGLTDQQTEDQNARRTISLSMAAEAGLFFARSQNLSEKEKTEISATSHRVEALAPADHIAVVTRCTLKVEEWFQKGTVTPTEASQAMEAVNMLLKDAQKRKKP